MLVAFHTRMLHGVSMRVLTDDHRDMGAGGQQAAEGFLIISGHSGRITYHGWGWQTHGFIR